MISVSYLFENPIDDDTAFEAAKRLAKSRTDNYDATENMQYRAQEAAKKVHYPTPFVRDLADDDKIKTWKKFKLNK